MVRNHRRCLTALGATPLIALLAFAPDAVATTQPTARAAPNSCHGLSSATDQYTLGCRAGVKLGTTAGNKNGSPPICQKLPPPLSPVKPDAYEQGLRVGYQLGYDRAFAASYKRNCVKKPLPSPSVPKPPPEPQPQTQTLESMAAAGQAAGATWGRDDGKTCTRAHAELVPPAKPDPFISAYQNGYRVGYDTAYDEAYRTNCLNK